MKGRVALAAKILIVLLLGAWGWASAVAAQQAAAAPDLTDREKEVFLRTARIVRTQPISEGVTNSVRLTLSDGRLTHDAHFQSIDEYSAVRSTNRGTETNFSDSYKHNIAAYLLDRMLGLNMVPVSVERRVGGESGAVTWWVDDVLMSERDRYVRKVSPPDAPAWNNQMYVLRVFDALIYNTDRNLGNVLIEKGWRIWMIDHTRAFRFQHRLPAPQALARCDRKLFASLQGLDESELRRQLRDHLNGLQLQGLIARRDEIVRLFQERIGEQGEDAVLYDYLASR